LAFILGERLGKDDGTWVADRTMVIKRDVDSAP
jgi:hypothetical protein